MITRIEIDGFKTFRRFALDLEPLQIIVGPTSAGKSNFFDALKLLSYLVDANLADALAGGRGRIADQFTWQRDGSSATITLAVELLLPMGVSNGVPVDDTLTHTRIRYEVCVECLELETGVVEVTVLWECMRSLHQATDTWIARHQELAPFAVYGEVGTFLMMDTESTLLSRYRHIFTPYVAAVRSELARVRFPMFDLSAMRQVSDRAGLDMLAPDGSNLPTVLALLSPASLAHVRADLADLVPGARLLDVVAARDEFWIEVEFGDRCRFPARVLSDGTLRLLGISTLLRSSLPGTVIVYDGLDNGVPPGRFRRLFSKLLCATAPADALPVQILMTMYSPMVLAVLHDRPRMIVFADLVRQPDGLRVTRMRHVAEVNALDRGATTVSHDEIKRYFDMARLEEV